MTTSTCKFITDSWDPHVISGYGTCPITVRKSNALQSINCEDIILAQLHEREQISRHVLAPLPLTLRSYATNHSLREPPPSAHGAPGPCTGSGGRTSRIQGDVAWHASAAALTPNRDRSAPAGGSDTSSLLYPLQYPFHSGTKFPALSCATC